MTACSFCGAANDPASRFCIDCGKPLAAQAGRPAPAMMAAATGMDTTGSGKATTPPSGFYALEKTCPRCAKSVDPTLPFCGHCGAKVASDGRAASCNQCGAEYIQGAVTPAGPRRLSPAAPGELGEPTPRPPARLAEPAPPRRDAP